MVGKAPRRFTSRGVSILPLLLMGVTHLSIPPLQSMFELEPMLMYGWYAIAVVLGLLCSVAQEWSKTMNTTGPKQ